MAHAQHVRNNLDDASAVAGNRGDVSRDRKRSYSSAHRLVWWKMSGGLSFMRGCPSSMLASCGTRSSNRAFRRLSDLRRHFATPLFHTDRCEQLLGADALIPTLDDQRCAYSHMRGSWIAEVHCEKGEEERNEGRVRLHFRRGISRSPAHSPASCRAERREIDDDHIASLLNDIR
jgi:hypothetical protein